MSLRSSLEDLEAALTVKENQRDVAWGYSLCTYCRFVHVSVWTFCPDYELLKNEIIPLLLQAEDAVISMPFEDFEKEERRKLVKYARNMALRIHNLEQNYLQDRPSGFGWDDRLEEQQEEEIWRRVINLHPGLRHKTG